jgi:hypothetical protein
LSTQSTKEIIIMAKNKTLVNENVIRRWGKLASIPALTENYLDTLEEESFEDAEDAEAGAMDAMDDAMDQMDGAEDDLNATEDETERAVVDRVVTAVVAALSDATDVEIEVEGAAEGEEITDAELELVDDDGEGEVEFEEEEELDPGMRAYNRKDIEERKKGSWKKGVDDNPSGKKDDGSSKGDESATDPGDEDDTFRAGKPSKTHAGLNRNRKDETLELDVIDDEELTEAVLRRVVERLLQRK